MVFNRPSECIKLVFKPINLSNVQCENNIVSHNYIHTIILWAIRCEHFTTIFCRIVENYRPRLSHKIIYAEVSRSWSAKYSCALSISESHTLGKTECCLWIRRIDLQWWICNRVWRLRKYWKIRLRSLFRPTPSYLPMVLSLLRATTRWRVLVWRHWNVLASWVAVWLWSLYCSIAFDVTQNGDRAATSFLIWRVSLSTTPNGTRRARRSRLTQVAKRQPKLLLLLWCLLVHHRTIWRYSAPLSNYIKLACIATTVRVQFLRTWLWLWLRVELHASGATAVILSGAAFETFRPAEANPQDRYSWNLTPVAVLGWDRGVAGA